jgi:dipeptidase E
VRRLLLHAGGDVASALDDIAEHLGGAQRAVFLPYALADHDAYTARISERLGGRGVRIIGLHTAADPAEMVAGADAIVVGGGNSFRLVKALHDLALIDPVRERVAAGIPYFGASAGTNVACPTIRTTNDMPIVQPASLAAFDLVPFQINPHYIDPPPPEQRIGETRAERLREFLEENDVPVVALREQSWLIVHGDAMTLRGTGGAVLFRRGREEQEISPGAELSWLLEHTPRA